MWQSLLFSLRIKSNLSDRCGIARPIVQMFPSHHPRFLPRALRKVDWRRIRHNYQKPIEFTQKLITPYGFLVYYNHPTYFKVTRLVKEVKCQYAFGVFTKWDQAIQESEKAESHEQISLDFLRETNTKKYLQSLNSRDQRATIHDVFFVDSQHVLRQIKVSSFFQLWSTYVKKFYFLIESTLREWYLYSIKFVLKVHITARTSNKKMRFEVLVAIVTCTFNERKIFFFNNSEQS